MLHEKFGFHFFDHMKKGEIHWRKSAHEMGLPPAGGETTKEATARKRRPGANCVLNGDEA